MQMVRGEQAGHGDADAMSAGAMRVERRAEMDPEVRGQRIAELAQRLGVDVDELTAALESSRADRAAMRDTFAGMKPAERREAMRAFAEAQRSALADALGVDPDILAELHMEAGRGPRGPQSGRMGPQARG